jgi:hypothetical protein
MDLLQGLHADEQLSMILEVMNVTTNYYYYFVCVYIYIYIDTQHLETNCAVQLCCLENAVKVVIYSTSVTKGLPDIVISQLHLTCTLCMYLATSRTE